MPALFSYPRFLIFLFWLITIDKSSVGGVELEGEYADERRFD